MKIVKNDLFDYGLEIYQGELGFKFSLDSILLAEFVDSVTKEVTVLDMCTGNAPVPLILSTKILGKIKGFEIQKEVAELADCSIKLNNLQDRIQIINDDINNIDKYFEAGYFDVITCNPPFFKANETSILNECLEKAIARHEIKVTLESILKKASFCLRNKGMLYLVHRPERLQEILTFCSKYNLFIKKIQFVFSNIQENAHIVLIKAVKNGNLGTVISAPMCVNSLKTYKNIFKDV